MKGIKVKETQQSLPWEQGLYCKRGYRQQDFVVWKLRGQVRCVFAPTLPIEFSTNTTAIF